MSECIQMLLLEPRTNIPCIHTEGNKMSFKAKGRIKLSFCRP